MGIFDNVKVCIAQLEIREGSEPICAKDLDQAIAYACEQGAHIVVAPDYAQGFCSTRVIALNGAELHEAQGFTTLALGGKTFALSIDADNRDADLVIKTEKSPWWIEKTRAGEPCTPCVVIKPVGMTNSDKTVCAYDGGSFACNENGEIVLKLNDQFAAEVACIGDNRGNVRSVSGAEKLFACLTSTIKRFDEHVLGGSAKWVIGLSGGLDSSVVAALLAKALGNERIVGYNLASRYNTASTRNNATQIAEALGIELRTGSIQSVVDQTCTTVIEYGYPQESTSGIVLENIQARVRGHMLSTFSAIEGGVVVNNGNRVESALGYATMYGDAIGALAPIADLTKVQLFNLAREINTSFGREVVPENLLPTFENDVLSFGVAPSAELANDQIDPMKWFYHDWLITELLDKTALDPAPILKRYASGKLFDEPVGKWVFYYGLNDAKAFVDDLERTVAQIHRAAFKRIQAPPRIAIASRESIEGIHEHQGPFGFSEEYNQLKHELLSE